MCLPYPANGEWDAIPKHSYAAKGGGHTGHAPLSVSKAPSGANAVVRDLQARACKSFYTAFMPS